MENNIELANKIFADISKKLLPNEKGKIVAIDPQTGKYALGSTELEAYNKIAKEHPKKQFVFKRLGFASTHFTGAF